MNKIVCYTLGMIALTVSTAQAQGPAFNLGQGQLLSQTTAVPPAVSPVPMPEGLNRMSDMLLHKRFLYLTVSNTSVLATSPPVRIRNLY